MSHFTEKELAFIQSQRLGRLATVSPDGKPQNAPVGFRYNPELDTIEIGGANMAKSKKFRNIQTNPYVAFVIDEVLPPWKPRGVEIRGRAEAITSGSRETIGVNFSDDAFIRITPDQIIGWGIDDPNAYISNNRKIK